MLDLYMGLLEINRLQSVIIDKAVELLLLHVSTEDKTFCEIMNMREEVKQRESEDV